jgi:tryptophan-rich sensory protein
MSEVFASGAAGGLLVPSIVAGLVALGVAVLGGLLTDVGPWYQELRFPSWKPPNWLFGPAWTVIFTLIAIGAVLAWRDAPSSSERTLLLVLFGVNAVLNVLWSALFFAMRRPDWALVEVALLWLSILVLVLVIRRYSDVAAACLLPYLAWVSFAAVLNRTIVRLNPGMGLSLRAR